jgi:hypothetical protein
VPVTPPGAVPVGLVVVVTTDDVVDVVDVVDDVELLPESPLPPQPTANVSTAAPPTNVIVALEKVLDPRGMRPSLPC